MAPFQLFVFVFLLYSCITTVFGGDYSEETEPNPKNNTAEVGTKPIKPIKSLVNSNITEPSTENTSKDNFNSTTKQPVDGMHKFTKTATDSSSAALETIKEQETHYVKDNGQYTKRSIENNSFHSGLEADELPKIDVLENSSTKTSALKQTVKPQNNSKKLNKHSQTNDNVEKNDKHYSINTPSPTEQSYMGRHHTSKDILQRRQAENDLCGDRKDDPKAEGSNPEPKILIVNKGAGSTISTKIDESSTTQLPNSANITKVNTTNTSEAQTSWKTKVVSVLKVVGDVLALVGVMSFGAYIFYSVI